MGNNKFFLISFLPALAYWYLEENYPLKIALIGGLTLAILEIILEKVFTKHVHTISKFNFYLILGLGLISLAGDDGLWFKLQPMFTGVIIGIYLFYRVKFKKKGIMLEMMESLNNRNLPPQVMNQLELHCSFLFFFYGLFMAYVALTMETKAWVFYKTAGFYITSFIFLIFEFFYIRFSVKKLMKR